jgi:8-oxo-dGTP pyrophosphatase MutT (NUDIX family)
MNELAKRILEVEGVQSSANRRPRDAATLIVVDRTGPIPKVMLGKRHSAHAFLPGKFVFPGGRVEPSDRLMAVAAPLDTRVEVKLRREVSRASHNSASALALAAIRETFEETGLLLGTRDYSARTAPAGPWREFVLHHVLPDLSVLHFIARAITPPRYPRRFDTRFFAVDASAIADRVDRVVHADAELVELIWLPIAEVRQLDILVITNVVLQELEARVSAGMRHDLPVPFYRMKHGNFIRAEL